MVADFNKDGNPDLAVANYTSYSVSVLLGDGTGNFSATNFGVTSEPTQVAVGDFNGDGNLDLVTDSFNEGKIAVLLGDGTGGFSLATKFTVGGQLNGVAVGDFNGDGKEDVAVNASSDDKVAVLPGDGSGGFATPIKLTVNNSPTAVAVGDFNGDNKLDLAVSGTSDLVAVLVGDGSGGFSAPTNLSVGYRSYSVVVGDFNGDGKPDSATASFDDNTASVVLSQAALVFAGGPVCAGQSVTVSVSTCLGSGGPLSVEISSSSGSFAAPTPLGAVSPGINQLTIPAATPAGSGYRIRVVGNEANAPGETSASFQINAPTSFNSTPTVSQTPVCAGAVVKVSFTVKAGTCFLLAETTFTAQLSDATGSFASATTLGVVSPGINTVSVPQSTPTGSGYRVRVVATADPTLISSSSAAFTVNQPSFVSTPTISGDNKCAGQPVRLSFAVGCPFPAGNTFTAYLSDASGSFAGGGTPLGSVNAGTGNVVIPGGTPAGTGYKIRLVSSNPMLISTASANFKVKACTNSREVALEETGLQVVVSPNPAIEGRLKISVSGIEGQRLTVTLFNGLGQSIRQHTVERAAAEEDVLEWKGILMAKSRITKTPIMRPVPSSLSRPTVLTPSLALKWTRMPVRTWAMGTGMGIWI